MAEIDKTELRQEYEQIWKDLADLLWQAALAEGFQANLSQILDFLKGHGIVFEDEYPELTTYQRILGEIRAGHYEDLTQGKVMDLGSLTDALRPRLKSVINSKTPPTHSP